MIDWQKDVLPWVTLAIALAALGIAWRGFRINNASWLAKQPYLEKPRHVQDRVVRLAGPEAEHWQITSIRLIWPLRATFLRNDCEYDSGGSIVRNWLTPVGKRLPDHSLPMIVSGNPSFNRVLVTAASRTRPITTKRWLITAKSAA